MGELARIRECWPEAMRRVVEAGVAHPETQERFLGLWTRVGWGDTRQLVGDDDLWLAALRILLPRYDGPDAELYRGQRAGDAVGASWTRSYHTALKFALHGDANVDPLRLHKAHHAARAGGTILRTHADRSAIICAPCLLGHKEGEYILDPRRCVPAASSG